MKKKKLAAAGGGHGGLPGLHGGDDEEVSPSGRGPAVHMGGDNQTPLMSDHDPDIGEQGAASPWSIRVSVATAGGGGKNGTLKTPLVANAINSLTDGAQRKSVQAVTANLAVGDKTSAGAEGHNVLSDYNLVRAKAKSVVKHSTKNFNTLFQRKPRKSRTRAHGVAMDQISVMSGSASNMSAQSQKTGGASNNSGGLGVPGSRDANLQQRPGAASMVVEDLPMSFFASPTGADGSGLHSPIAEEDDFLVVNKPALEKAAGSGGASLRAPGVQFDIAPKTPNETNNSALDNAADLGGVNTYRLDRESMINLDDDDEPKYCGPVVKAWRLILFVADAPFILLRSLTIPQLDDPPDDGPSLQKSESMLDMTNVVEINPTFLSISLFLSLAFLAWVIDLHVEVWIPLLVFGSVLSVVFFKKCQQWELKTPASIFGKVRVRLDRRIQLGFLALAFVMSIVWVYAFASLLIDLLQTTGDALGISPNILGLTVVAWGNSLGDFIADVVLAQKGHARMAAAGCIGSPCFSMLMGLGMGMTYKAASNYPEPFHLEWARNVPFTFVYLICVILCTTIMISLVFKFRFVRRYGYFLLTIYGGFLFLGLLGETGAIRFSAMGYSGPEV